MSDTNEIVTPSPNFDSFKDIIVKWVHILFLCQIANLFTNVLGAITAIGSIAGWLSRIVTVVIIIALFNLAVVNERYRKAALFYGISVGGGILSALLNKNMFGVVFSICSIVASYHELNAHSEITASKNAKLSKRWHFLFFYQMVVGLISGFISSAGVVIAVLAEMNPDAIVSFALIVTALVGVILGLFHVMYLKQTLRLYNE